MNAQSTVTTVALIAPVSDKVQDEPWYALVQNWTRIAISNSDTIQQNYPTSTSFKSNQKSIKTFVMDWMRYRLMLLETLDA
jgi:hypothetical protein